MRQNKASRFQESWFTAMVSETVVCMLQDKVIE